MSAFFVSDETIDAIVTLMRRRGLATIPDSDPDLARFVCYGPAMNPDACGRQLLRLNFDAMLARYPGIVGTPEDAEMVVALWNYHFTARNEDDAFLAKQLACLTYQCSEGDIPHRPLFLALIDFENRVTPAPITAALTRNPAACAARRAYDAAPWGIDGDEMDAAQRHEAEQAELCAEFEARNL